MFLVHKWVNGQHEEAEGEMTDEKVEEKDVVMQVAFV